MGITISQYRCSVGLWYMSGPKKVRTRAIPSTACFVPSKMVPKVLCWSNDILVHFAHNRWWVYFARSKSEFQLFLLKIIYWSCHVLECFLFNTGSYSESTNSDHTRCHSDTMSRNESLGLNYTIIPAITHNDLLMISCIHPKPGPDYFCGSCPFEGTFGDVASHRSYLLLHVVLTLWLFT